MKTLIVFSTKYGCTEKCVDILKSQIQGEVHISLLKDIKADLRNFDNIIVGGSVYMGKIQKEILRFCNKNKRLLLSKKLSLFACCYTPKDTEGFFETLFPNDILEHATYTTTFGGEMQYDKMNFLYRKMFESLKKIDGFNAGFKEPDIDMEEIKKVAALVSEKGGNY